MLFGLFRVFELAAILLRWHVKFLLITSVLLLNTLLCPCPLASCSAGMNSDSSPLCRWQIPFFALHLEKACGSIYSVCQTMGYLLPLFFLGDIKRSFKINLLHVNSTPNKVDFCLF